MLARKISRPKWTSKPYLDPDCIRADGVTSCLRTVDDRLSLWRCENDEESVDDVFLALATARGKTGFDAMDIVLIPEEELRRKGLTEEATPGDTAVEDLRLRHVDLICLDMEGIAEIAQLVSTCVNKNRSIRLTVSRVKSLVRRAASEGRVRKDLLNPKLREQV